MGKHDATAKKIHLSRIGDDGLTMCGRKYGWQSDGTLPSRWFTNPDAKLCGQCQNLTASDGLTVKVTWVSIGDPTDGHWRVSATPPMLRLYSRGINTVIVDQNDPEAPAVTLTHDKLEDVLGPRALRVLWDEYGSDQSPEVVEPGSWRRRRCPN